MTSADIALRAVRGRIANIQAWIRIWDAYLGLCVISMVLVFHFCGYSAAPLFGFSLVQGSLGRRRMTLRLKQWQAREVVWIQQKLHDERTTN